MANYYALTLPSITLSAVTIAINPGKATALIATDVIIEKWNGTAFASFTDFTLESPTTTGGIITPTTAFLQTDVILIQINDGTNLSDRMMADFSQAFTGHTASYNFQLPAEAGKYNLKLGTVNGNDFSAVETAQFDLGTAPDTGHSSISMTKGYLVKFVNSLQTVQVVLNNAAGDADTGNYEVTVDANLV